MDEMDGADGWIGRPPRVCVFIATSETIYRSSSPIQSNPTRQLSLYRIKKKRTENLLPINIYKRITLYMSGVGAVAVQNILFCILEPIQRLEPNDFKSYSLYTNGTCSVLAQQRIKKRGEILQRIMRLDLLNDWWVTILDVWEKRWRIDY